MSTLSRRYLSVWLSRLAIDRIARRLPVPDDAALVVVAPVKSALRIVALNAVAARNRLKTGMTLADGRAMYPEFVAVGADLQADFALLEAIADDCERYTPLVALDPPDGLVLDITGCAHLFGGEMALVRDVVARLVGQGLEAQAAVADTVGCAWGTARYGTTPVIAKGKAHKALSALPLAALRIPPDTVTDLAQVGLRYIADVLDRPRAPLAARFGQDFIRRVDQVLGREDEPITPRLPLPAAMAERRFAEPIAHEVDVMDSVEHLARELDRVLERRGEGARLIQLVLFRADGKLHRLEIGTAAPLRDPLRVRRLFSDRLTVLGDACDPGFGFDMVRLSALATERLDPVQMGLSDTGDRADLVQLIDRLGARFGLRCVCRLAPQDTHIPEFAVAAIPAHAARPAVVAAVVAQDSLSPARPMRLFARPEPIETVAEVPDGPPLRFRWRQVLHEVTTAEGPERIAMQWWRDDQGRALTRDYFRVESKEGARLWLYREGLYGRETPQPRWFMHGLFA